VRINVELTDNECQKSDTGEYVAPCHLHLSNSKTNHFDTCPLSTVYPGLSLDLFVEKIAENHPVNVDIQLIKVCLLNGPIVWLISTCDRQCQPRLGALTGKAI